MNEQKLKKRYFSGLLVVVLVLLLFTPLAYGNNVCDDALKKCGTDAVIAGIMGGPAVFPLYLALCLVGFEWCSKYYL